MNMANVQAHIHGLLNALGSRDDIVTKGALLSLNAKELEILDKQILEVKKVQAGAPLPASPADAIPA